MILTSLVFALIAALFVTLHVMARRQAREHPLGHGDAPTLVRLVYGPAAPRPFDWQQDDT